MKADLIQFEFIDRTLRRMVLAAETRFTELDFTITSLYRIGDMGVHGQLPLRGIDIRCNDDVLGGKIVKWVNKRYRYDYERPHLVCCIYHDVGFGKHLHFQVHRNTFRTRAL